ncbi:hypothetical protein M501DRAFT_973024 [Patellaria atrata CBS 101060]|uniref:ER-bound oxygenase mpaB/mpaB'/Rubber oxygenase catalytic domain-containing protein n=1 Tax=Patellaria atrata CBS 101060 TaxID=1346257 RepID=A0A9P4SBH3_9PEZI|nr:hypothetical protein M501DRAFT_973024 [Patellaria atrata CBS 101060]
MAWPNPFRRRTEKTRTCWGYTFDVTDDHLTPEQTYPLKYTYDVLAEECLRKLDEISPPPRSALPRNNDRYSDKANTIRSELKDIRTEGNDEPSPPPPRDLYALLQDHAETDPKLKQLWTQVSTVPEWVDWAQIGRGQDVFYRYGGTALTGLAYQSLLGGMGAARVVETLARTGGFSTKVARHRLFETTQHILQCTKSIDSLQPGGEGFASTIRVRFLHAAVRKRILTLAETRPEYYSVEKWGVPINDLDSMATIATFSASLIWIGWPRQGIFLRRQEIDDYVALWRYIAYVIGCPADMFEAPAKAKAVMETLLYYEVQPTETSKILASNIIKSLQDRAPSFASADMLVAGARWLNGNELIDRLGLPRPGLYYWALMAGQCLFFMFMCYSYRLVPSWDRERVKWIKKIFYQIIVESKFGLKGKVSAFDFKYVPEYSTITEMGESEKAELKYPGVERRNLKALCIGLGVLCCGVFCTVKLATGFFHIVGRPW